MHVEKCGFFLSADKCHDSMNSISMVYLHDNVYLYDCIGRLYYIILYSSMFV